MGVHSYMVEEHRPENTDPRFLDKSDRVSIHFVNPSAYFERTIERRLESLGRLNKSINFT